MMARWGGLFLRGMMGEQFETGLGAIESSLEEAGVAPPTTIDEMMAAAKAMTKRDGAGNLTQVGITAGMTAQDHHWWREGLIRQQGGEACGAA